MAKIKLKEGADPLGVAEDLRKIGVTMKQRLPDGCYVAYVDKKKWLLVYYPALADLFAEDRAFWKSVRKRTRQGEDVSQAEIKAHADAYNRRMEEIIASYESDDKGAA